MREILRDLSPGQDYALSFQAVGDGAVSAWSQVFRFRTAGDIVAPAVPTGLTWRATGSSFMGIWNPVTLDGNGSPLKDFKDFEVTVTAGGVSKVFYVTQPTFELTLSMNAETFGTIAYTVQIDVRSRDQTGNKSLALSATATEDTPPQPSTPVVGVLVGQLSVTWDGQPATGLRNELNLDHVEIHVSATSGFTPSTATNKGRFEGVFPRSQTTIIAGLTYGTTYYVKLVAINRFNRAGTPSAQASGAPVRITGLDIQDGQISAAEINFTAYDIGGANAYYPATVTAMNAISTAKANDIAYVTGSNYATYRYNGSSWVTAPEVGQLAGTKIIAGTLTSNAVGTNLLIASNANIADGIIDNAKISNLDGGKITAGTLTANAIGANTIIANAANIQDGIITSAKISSLAADKISAGTINSAIVVSGRFATALTGKRMELNGVGLQGWDVGGNQTVNIDGVSNLLTGQFKTALTGRRLEMGASGGAGRIDFYAPNGSNGFFQSYTESGGTTEALQFGLTIPAATATGTNAGVYLWNRINYNNDHGGYSNYRANRHEFIMGGATGAGGTDTAANAGLFHIFQTSDYGNTGFVRFEINSSNLVYNDQSNKQRLVIDAIQFIVNDSTYNRMGVNATQFFVNDSTGQTRIYQDASRITLNSNPAAGNVSQFLQYNITGTDQGRFWLFGASVSGTAGSQSQFNHYGAGNTECSFGDGEGTWKLILLGSGHTSGAPNFSSPALQLFTGSGFGTLWKSYYDSIRGLFMEARDWPDTGFVGLRASVFEVNSSETQKQGIKEFTGALDTIKQLTPREYRRSDMSGPIAESKNVRSPQGDGTISVHTGRAIRPKKAHVGPRTIGFVSEEVHELIGRGENVDLYSIATLGVSGVKELHVVVENHDEIIQKLTARVEELENELKK